MTGRFIIVIFLLMEKYDIMDVIDEGAYGIVWKAVNRETGGVVAIKEFKEGDEDEFSKKTIQREIKMLKMLKSEYVVGIKEAFKKKGKIYLIFQYFEHNLLNLIEKFQHGLEAKLINFIIYKIVKCVQYLHSKNIIHRDVKPQNILLNHDYTALKICDFGFARFLPEKDYDLTEYVATRWYRSPELLVGQPYGKAADIWAIGCMIGELVDGQPMFPGDDEIDQIYLINKLTGNLTLQQQNYFARNPKFQNINLPQVRRSETIDTRYLGKIQKNALSFMKACLKMDPAERMTVQEALKHPYLLSYSLDDNEFADDEQNLLQHRKGNIRNESKVTITTLKDEEDRMLFESTKILKNNSITKKGLKLEGGSMNERSMQPPLVNSPEIMKKKKSQANFQNRHQESIQKYKPKKLAKMLSEQKNLKLNLDVNVKINLNIKQKSVQKRDSKNILQKRLEKKLDMNQNPLLKGKLLPEIKNNTKGLRYQLNIRHQKINQLISVVGETKELIRGSKINLQH